MYLADAFIQSDLAIQAIHFFYQYVCSLGIEPTTLCAAKAMLYHWATGTLQPQNLKKIPFVYFIYNIFCIKHYFKIKQNI